MQVLIAARPPLPLELELELPLELEPELPLEPEPEPGAAPQRVRRGAGLVRVSNGLSCARMGPIPQFKQG